MKRAIIQCADSGPVESLAVMLRSVGYQCFLPGATLRSELQRAGADTVLSPEELERSWGYDPIDTTLVERHKASPADLLECDLYVDVKAHRNGPLLWKRWPMLERKILWYRINGGMPEHVIRKDGFDCGDEVNPPCPVLTPNQWYKIGTMSKWIGEGSGVEEKLIGGNTPWNNKAYTCWPPFHRFNEYPARGANPSGYPICLIHNLQGWGYGALVDPFHKLGVKMYGVGSPNGLIPHSEVGKLLQGCRAYVHLKSSDAPGYALYEALAAACPVVCTRRLIWRCKMQGLLIPGETCLVFDRETHDGLTPEDVVNCTGEVKQHLADLQSPFHNRHIGEAGRERLRQVMWSTERTRDVESLSEFMVRHFGG